MNMDDNSEKPTMDDTVLDLYSEELEDYYDDFQQSLLESDPAEPPFPRAKYSYKQILGIRIIRLPLLVVFISLAAWMNSKLPHCEFRSSP